MDWKLLQRAVLSAVAILALAGCMGGSDNAGPPSQGDINKVSKELQPNPNQKGELPAADVGKGIGGGLKKGS